jgi:hypothetical protein
MIALRNVLLTANGALLLLVPAAIKDQGTAWVLYVFMAYLLVDFAYLALTYPRRPFAEYVVALFSETPITPKGENSQQLVFGTSEEVANQTNALKCE